MTGHPHPKGPERGRVYATPEEALASGDPGIIVPIEDFRETLEDPRVAELMAAVEPMAVDAMTLEEYNERFGQPGGAA